MIRLKLIIVVLLCCCNQLYAQLLTSKSFYQYTPADGLSSSTVTGVVQDSTGYVWISTDAGLNRFNGSRFLQFHTSDDSLSLAADEVSQLGWLDSRRFGAYTAAGLHIVDTRTGKTRNLFVPYHNQQYLYKFNTVHGAKADDQGNIFLLTRSGFYHFKDFQLVFRFDYYKDADLKNSHFHFGTTILEVDGKHLLVVSEGGLFQYTIANKEFRKLRAGEYPLLDGLLERPNNYRFLQHKAGSFFLLKQFTDSLVYVDLLKKRRVVSKLPFDPGRDEFHFRTRLFPVSDSIFYITSHTAGFYKMIFDSKSGRVNFLPEKHFPSFPCTAILKDRDNNFWVATNKGIFRQDLRRNNVQFATIPTPLTDSFPNIRLSSLFVSGDKVYAGARGDAGLLLFDKEQLRFEKQLLFDTKNTFNNHVRVIARAGDDQLLLGTAGVLILFNRKTNTSKKLLPPNWNVGADWTNDLYIDKKGKIWISAASRIYQFNPDSATFRLMPLGERLINFPVYIQQNSRGDIWLASHGLAKYDSTTGALTLMVDSVPAIKMPDKQVSTFVFDKRNTVWFNSHNNGLIGYDYSRNSFRQFTTRDGLPDNGIYSLTIVGNRIWMACYARIACLDLETSKIVSFGKEDGLPDMPVVPSSKFFYDESSRKLYLPYSHAIARFDPEQILQKKTPPHIFIEDIAINNKRTFLPADNVKTTWQNNEIKIAIGTINFSDPATQRFAYRIVRDTSSQWIEMADQASFSISSLPPGKHRIQVKVYSRTNRWPEQVKEFNIVVSSPFWLESWFLALTGILLILFVYLLVRWQKEVARKKEMEKTYVEKLKVDHYKNQFELEQITNYFSSCLEGKKTEEEVLWDVTSNLIARMDYEDCVIYLWNENKTRMIQKAAYGPKGAPEIIASTAFEVSPGQGVVGHVIETHQPVLVKDTREDHRYRIDDENRLSEVAVPIIHNKELLGVIDSEHSKLNYFSERDIKILTTIATLIGNKIKQIQSDQTLEAKQIELAGINEQLAEARLSALQAQMNPHFVFNALNSIKRMILDGENERASRYMSKFAMMIRLTLEHSKQVFVTLDDNIEYLKAYLEMEQLRFDDSFTYSINADNNVESHETLFPTMMIQPLVENAIWHGLMQARRDKELKINFSQTHTKTICTIEDNGIGIRRSEQLRETHRPLHRSVGLQNLQKRMKIMNEKYDTDCDLQIYDLAEADKQLSGTKVVLQLKLITI